MSIHRFRRPLLLGGVLLLIAAQSPAQQPQRPAKPRAKPAVAAPAAAATTPAGSSSSNGSARCGEEEALPSSTGGTSASVDAGKSDPRGEMQRLVALAQQRSKALGVSTLLAQAARDDWEEAKAGRMPTVSLGGTLGASGHRSTGFPMSSGPSAQLGLSAAMPAYDGGRTSSMMAWRTQLAEAARHGLINNEQQLALQTVSLAMDRSRYVQQIQVYGQYVRQMVCLVEALDTIVKADRGRASELVQAVKNRQQAELAVDQTRTALRQTEVRLRRFVGDELPPVVSFAALLPSVPPLPEMLADAGQAAEVAQIEAQTRAQERYAEVVRAGTRPRVDLMVQGNGNVGPNALGETNKSADVVVGVSLSIPLFNAAADPSIAAANKRAEAARLQRDDAIEGRRYRMADVHEAAVSSFDRARSIVDILRSSDQLRSATLMQWQQLGRRSLFDVMGAQADYYGMRVAHINAIYDGQQAVAMLWSLGRGVMTPLR